MFHVELRQFPHVARAFNVDREELESRILLPWVEGRSVELDDRAWDPDRARIAIFEGRALEGDEIGMGRGWGNVTRTGTDVTERLIAAIRGTAERPPAVLALKGRLIGRCAHGPLRLWEVVDATGEDETAGLASARLALAEQAVWELLHEGLLSLMRGETRLDRSEWQAVLLRWSSWREDGVFLELAPERQATD